MVTLTPDLTTDELEELLTAVADREEVVDAGRLCLLEAARVKLEADLSRLLAAQE